MVKRGKSLASSVRISQEDSAPILNPEMDSYAKIIESRGKGQFLVSLPSRNTKDTNSAAALDGTDTDTILIYMPPRFRNALWIRRGSFVIIRKYDDQSHAELLHILTPPQVKEIRKAGGWPGDFTNEVMVMEDDEISLSRTEDENEIDQYEDEIDQYEDDE